MISLHFLPALPHSLTLYLPLEFVPVAVLSAHSYSDDVVVMVSRETYCAGAGLF